MSINKTYKSMSAGQIIKTAHVGTSGANLTEIFVRAIPGAYVYRGERPDGWGGKIADVLCVITSDRCIARLKMGPKADDRLAHLALIAGR